MELVPLCTAVLLLAKPIDLGVTPLGHRMVAEIASATFTGDRFTAEMIGKAAADWYTRSPDGTIGTPDVRITVQTQDGARVLIRYSGRLDTTNGAGGSTAYVAPTFETGDVRYDWLNRIQAVGKGIMSPDVTSLRYELYELR